MARPGIRPNIPRAIDSVIPQHQLGNGLRRSHHSTIRQLLKKGRLPLTVAVVVVILATGAVLWHISHQPQLSEVNQVVQDVGKLYILPSKEQPVLATVTDKNKLATPFLKQANDGDKVLIYVKAKIVIIYRPSLNKIVAVGPVDISPPPSQTSTVSTP